MKTGFTPTRHSATLHAKCDDRVHSHSDSEAIHSSEIGDSVLLH